MCFSAAASFASGGFLACAGIATLRQVRRPEQVPFAAIPCMFALQQCAEGLTWLGLTQRWSAGWQHATEYAFLIFAQIVWPVWIPLAIRLIAPPDRKRALGIVLAVGVCVSLIIACCMLRYGAGAEIVDHHIAYAQPYPTFVTETCGLLYGVAIIAPPFMTGMRNMWLLGIGIAAAYLVADVIYQYYVMSVWCYISALVSVLIFAVQRANFAVPAAQRAPTQVLHPT
jgi:hypothetical protein